MDITWTAIGKIIVASLATYVLLPAALILRDFLLWKLIDVYILNNTLRSKVRTYALLADNWNTNFAKSITFNADSEEFHKHMKESQEARNELQAIELFINRKSQFLTWLLKHYKQETINPIQEWKKQAKEELENRKNKIS